MRPTSAMRTAVVLIATLLTIGACTDLGDPAGAPTTAPTVPPQPDPVLPALTVGDPVWSSSDLDGAVGAVELLDGAVATGLDDGRSMVVTDLATGDERWRIDSEIPGGDGAILWDAPLAASEDGSVVLVEYFLTECPTSLCPADESTHSDEKGIAALAANDGSLLWMTPLSPAVGFDDPARAYYRSLHLEEAAVGDGVVVVSVVNASGAEPPEGHSATESQGLDLRTGEPIWTTPGLTLPRNPGTAVWFDRFDPDAVIDSPEPPVGAVLIDPRTGEVLHETAEFRVLDSAADGAYLLATATNDGRAMLVSASGVETPSTAFSSCDGDQTLVCLDDGFNEGFEYDVDDGPPTQLTTFAGGEAVTSAWFPGVGGLPYGAGDYIWLQTDDEESVAIDVHGNVLSNPVPGTVRQLDGGHLLTQLTDGDRQFAVYPIG